MTKQVVGLVKALSSKRNWWSVCLNTQDGDVWLSPGIQATEPCPAMKGDLVTATVEGPYNRVVGVMKVESAHNIPVAQPTVRSGFVPKKTNVGIQVGHAINTAFDYGGYGMSIADLILIAKKMADITEECRAAYAEANPNMSEYDIGATCGHAVRNAAAIAGNRNLPTSDIKRIALGILNQVTPELTQYILNKNEQKAEQAQQLPAVETQPVEKPNENPDTSSQNSSEPVVKESLNTPVIEEVSEELPW